MLIDIKKASLELGIKPGTLYLYVAQGLVPYIKVGRLIKFDLPELIEHFRSEEFRKAREGKK